MSNKLPKFFDKHKICVICESNEEYEYLNRLKDLNVRREQYEIALVNVRGNGNIPARYRDCYQNGAVESKWCNWELGYGDAQKFDTSNIALFPVKPEKTYDYDYKGNEYMQIYPHIAYYYGNERYSNGTIIKEGLYVCTDTENGRTIMLLEKWFEK